MLFVLPALATVASGVAVAVVLTGSLAARVLGSVVAVGHLLALLGPAALGGVPLGLGVLLFTAVAAVHVGTVVALAVPPRTRPAPRADGPARA